jgi:hypothetical protein
VWSRGWVEVQLYSSMTAALEGGEWWAARPGRTLPPGKTRYPFYRKLCGPQGRYGLAENLVPTGIQSWTVQPLVSHYTDWATRPTFNFHIGCRNKALCLLPTWLRILKCVLRCCLSPVILTLISVTKHDCVTFIYMADALLSDVTLNLLALWLF